MPDPNFPVVHVQSPGDQEGLTEADISSPEGGGYPAPGCKSQDTAGQNQQRQSVLEFIGGGPLSDGALGQGTRAKERKDIEALGYSSLFIFPKVDMGENDSCSPRVAVYDLTHWRVFEALVVVLIFGNCFFLALDDPTQDEEDKPAYLKQMEYFFTACFATELCLKVYAQGFLLHPGSYLRNGWNRLDFVIVAFSFLAFIPQFGNYTAIRTLRVLRPLRSINGIQGLKNIVNAILHSMHKLVNVLALAAFLFAIFGILGVQLWAGKFKYRCVPSESFVFCETAFVNGMPMCCTLHNHSMETPVNPSCCMPFPSLGDCGSLPDGNPCGCTPRDEIFCSPDAKDVSFLGEFLGHTCPDGYDCNNTGENPNFGYTNFDQIGYAVLAIFQCLTMEGWTDIMYIVQDVHSDFGVVYFVLLVILGSFFVLNLALAVINEEFEQIREQDELRQRMEVQRLHDEEVERILAEIEEEEEWRRQCEVQQVEEEDYDMQDGRDDEDEDEDGEDAEAADGDGDDDVGNDCPETVENTSFGKVPVENISLGKVPGESIPVGQATQSRKNLKGDNEGKDKEGKGKAAKDKEGKDKDAKEEDKEGKDKAKEKKKKKKKKKKAKKPQTLPAAGGTSPQQDINLQVAVSTLQEGEPEPANCRERIVLLWRQLRWQCYWVVVSNWFTPTIIFFIVFNTICLALEHHNQPDELTSFLDLANHTLTWIFFVEMVLKLMASGFRGYLEDTFNVLDGGIVVVSIIEFSMDFASSGGASATGANVSVFRALRLLRVFKLLKNFPQLRSLVEVVIAAVDDTGYLNVIILLYIFSSSLVGMQFFGGEFQFPEDCPTSLVPCQEQKPRATFDDIYWSILTVFQVLTRDDWVNVMWNAMRSTHPAMSLFFLILVICGDFVILNLFLAILIQSFEMNMNEEEEEEEEEEETAPSPPDEADVLGSPASEHRDSNGRISTHHRISLAQSLMHGSAAIAPAPPPDEGHQQRGSHTHHLEHPGLRQNPSSLRLLESSATPAAGPTSIEAGSRGRMYSVSTPQPGPLGPRESSAFMHSVRQGHRESQVRTQWFMQGSTVQCRTELVRNKGARQSVVMDAFPIIGASRPVATTSSFRISPGRQSMLLHGAQRHVVRPRKSNAGDGAVPMPSVLPSGEPALSPTNQPLKSRGSFFAAATMKGGSPRARGDPTSPRLSGIGDMGARQRSQLSWTAPGNHAEHACPAPVPVVPMNTAKGGQDLSTHVNPFVLPQPSSPLSNEKTGRQPELYPDWGGRVFQYDKTVDRPYDSYTEEPLGHPLAQEGICPRCGDELLDPLWNKHDHDSKRRRLHERLCPSIQLRKIREMTLHRMMATIVKHQEGRRRFVLKPVEEVIGAAWEVGMFLDVQPSRLLMSQARTVLVAPAASGWDFEWTGEGKDAKAHPVTRVTTDSIAYNCTLRSGMRVLEVDGVPTPTVHSVTKALQVATTAGAKLVRLKVEPVNDGARWNELFVMCERQVQVLDLRLGEEIFGGSLVQFTRGRIPPIQGTNGGHSLGVFPADHWFRKGVYRVVQHQVFDKFILLCILAASLLMIAENPRTPATGVWKDFLDISNYVFTGVFIIEMLLKLVAFGFFLASKDGLPDVPYIRDPWNVLDMIIVLVSVLAIALENSNLQFLRVLRTFRALRPLRVISRRRGLRMVVVTLLRSMASIGPVALIAILVFLVFGILGVQLFAGKTHQCTDTAIFFRIACQGSFQDADGTWTHRSWRHWKPQQYFGLGNFDNIGWSMLTLFEVATLELWTTIMYMVIDAKSLDEAPERDANRYVGIFFIVFVVIGSFFILNLFVGFVIHNFEQVKKESDVLVTGEQQLWIETQRMMLNFTPAVKMRKGKGRTKEWMHDFATSTQVEAFIGVCILANVTVMGLEHDGMTYEWQVALEACNHLFNFVFLVEACVKLFAFSYSYFDDGWNRFDFGLVLLSIAQTTLLFLSTSLPIKGGILRIFRIFRIMRILRLVKSAKDVRILLETVWYSLPQIANIGGFMCLLGFIYAILGVNLFAKVRRGEYLNKHANFEDFPSALLMLVRIVTGENWNGVMHETMVQPPDCSTEKDDCGHVFASVYYITFIILAQFILTNLFVAIILNNFRTTILIEKSDLRMKDLHRFIDIWADFVPDANLVMPTSLFPQLLKRLGPPLGIKQHGTRIDILRRTTQYCIPEHAGLIHFIETLIPLARQVMVADAPLEYEDLRGHEEQWRQAFPDINALPILRFRQRRCTVDQYFSATYIAAAYRRSVAKRDFVERLAARRDAQRRWQASQKLLGGSTPVIGVGSPPQQSLVIAVSATDTAPDDQLPDAPVDLPGQVTRPSITVMHAPPACDADSGAVHSRLPPTPPDPPPR
eukprot:TRINITY_DN1582_c0_g5_i1.p1 TRINITY_DN1582_c0_g5~~TRINITY_DN1582_c0_g5_i1.p1  ORF type:complete len:2356 (+),score=741.40 TRINITY_DN1582_c0_g5_i1:94-7161(+)